MDDYFFGYGSLVNRSTHHYPEASLARLAGWRRVWCLTDQRPEAFLSVRRDPATTIDGLIAAVPQRDWQALDLRETGYLRHPVTEAVQHALPTPPQVQVYAIPDASIPGHGGHILLSYLDVVVQGFLQCYGPAGAAAFFATTDGWDRVILDDRANPLYPRHRVLTDAERAVVDTALTGVPAVLKPL
ncbi:gamma-glutamylcyclotransferase family protein [Pseudoruegeria sp. SK021]|uniref:gamma-glutamylcyclotransferase family protein n=1 Tax=Pseudoruegeria sp. SK021 TaxID=1933035 RepID=UPI000A216ED2|nr:gamma-glutamylcyclotransferase family protein [Pseudoruegeria sp. SK021]OSP56727.1 hypothetical protein BV911_01905 [Pseudoruegeria sp. SK021]